MQNFFSDANWLSILVASIAYFGLGAIWYSGLFGKQWIASHKIDVNDPEMKKGMAAIMITSFVLMTVAVLCLALLIYRLGLHEVSSGVKIGLYTGIGFAATAISIGYLYTKKPLGSSPDRWPLSCLRSRNCRHYFMLVAMMSIVNRQS